MDEANQERVKNIVGENIKICIDGAHNEAGASSLSHWARQNLTSLIYMILGMTNNRNVTEFCNHFQDIITQGIAVTVES